MTHIWRGPDKAVKASLVDPIALALHRRASRMLIAYNIADDGLSADVYRHRASDHARVDLGTVTGGDPLNTIYNVASQHTPHDAEFFALSTELVMRRLEEVTSECSDIVRSISTKMDEITEIVQSAQARYDRA